MLGPVADAIQRFATTAAKPRSKLRGRLTDQPLLISRKSQRRENAQ